MVEMKNNSCSTCKHGYEISGIDNHRLCGADIVIFARQ